jgi:5'-nucleotidase
MVAPSYNASGVSHSISFFKGPRKFAEIGRDSYSLDGTPADCVVVAVRGGIPEIDMRKGTPPDAVISGINHGANLGTDIVYSGTAAAARQGALNGIRSLALSLVHADLFSWDDKACHWNTAVAFVMERLDEMLAYWKPDTFVNVNIPNREEKPAALVRAFPGLRLYNDRITLRKGPDGETYCHCQAGVDEASGNPLRGSDLDVVGENNASLSEVYIHPVLLENVGPGCQG